MTNYPAPGVLSDNDTRLAYSDSSKGMILGVLHAKEKQGNFDAHGFPWASEKEVKELHHEGLLYLNRQTSKGIYAKLTPKGRSVDWTEYESPWNLGRSKRNPLAPKALTMRELLIKGMKEVQDG